MEPDPKREDSGPLEPVKDEDQERDEEQLPPPPPPPPLEPLLAVPALTLVAVGSDSARVEWLAASLTVPTTEDAVQLEVQQRTSYSVGQTELQMQEVDIDCSCSAGAAPVAGDSAVLAQARSKVVEEDWRTVHEAPCCSAEVRGWGSRAAAARQLAPLSRSFGVPQSCESCCLLILPPAPWSHPSPM
jgi:hypothetical protein